MTTPTERIDRFDVMYEHAERAPEPERAVRMVELYLQYLALWMDGDLDGMLGCLVKEPVFEGFPQRQHIVGRDAVRTRAERLLPIVRQLDPRVSRPETRALAFDQDFLIHELRAPFVLLNGTTKTCHLAVVIVFRGDRIIAERVYMDRNLEDLVNDALGPDFANLPGVEAIGEDGALLPDGADEGAPSAPAPKSPLECPELIEEARQIPSHARHAAMIDANLVYMQHYFDGNWEPMLDALIDEPSFEQFPQGIRIEGRDAVHERNSRGHAAGMKDMDPRIWSEDNHRITAAAVGVDMLIHEFSNVFTQPDGTKRRSYLLAVIPYVGDKLVGERVYGDGGWGRNWGGDFEKLPGVTVL